MLTVGLTGGIGSGKSTVAKIFSAKGVPVFDADVIVRELMEPGQPAWTEIIAEFGDSVLTEGRLNRTLLRNRIYSDPTTRRALESILHPKVYQILRERAKRVCEPYCIFAIPLLIESEGRDVVDRILLVDCPVEVQFERAMRRDGLDRPTVTRIIEVQASRAERLAAADDIIDNSSSIDSLPAQVERFHQIYLDLASHRPRPTLT